MSKLSLEEAHTFTEQKMKEGHTSDGCTMAPDFNFVECCYMHDMLIRFNKVSRKEADLLLKKCIRQKKVETWKRRYILKPLASIYHFAVRVYSKIVG